MFPPIFPPRLSQKWHMTVTENKKYPPKNKYYGELTVCSYTHLLNERYYFNVLLKLITCKGCLTK